MRAMLVWLGLLLVAAGAVRAEGERAGDFDYYVLSLSWTPGWCVREGDARRAPDCRPGAGLAFTLHGLWPQGERDWPSFCRSGARDPGRSQTAAMADIMGSDGLAWYQWKKHGRCSGLSAEAYFDLSRRAFQTVVRPDIFRRLRESVRIAPAVVEEAFREVNPGLKPDGITVTCREGLVEDVRICLTRDLRFRTCSTSANRECPFRSVEMPPPR